MKTYGIIQSPGPGPAQWNHEQDSARFSLFLEVFLDAHFSSYKAVIWQLYVVYAYLSYKKGSIKNIIFWAFCRHNKIRIRVRAHIWAYVYCPLLCHFWSSPEIFYIRMARKWAHELCAIQYRICSQIYNKFHQLKILKTIIIF